MRRNNKEELPITYEKKQQRRIKNGMTRMERKGQGTREKDYVLKGER